jgi:DNA-binding LytR/AlgR family response regulator
MLRAEPELDFQQFISGDEVVAYIKDQIDSISLYILDIRVPGELNGLDVAKAIRKMGSERPIILTSAYDKPDSKLLSALDCIWMPKPWHLIDAPKKILPLARK